MFSPHSYIGPSAQWLRDDDWAQDAYDRLCQEVAADLASDLRARADDLEKGIGLDPIINEVKRSMLIAVFNGDLGLVGECNELILSLLQAREDARRNL